MRLTPPSWRRSFEKTKAVSANEARRLSSLEVIAWSAWLGLTAGLLEVGMRVLCRAIDPTHRLYVMSRHFIWLTSLANMVLFVGLGLLLAGMTWCWPRFGGWISLRLLIALMIQPMLLVAWPAIFPIAWFLLAFGIAVAVSRLGRGAVGSATDGVLGRDRSRSGGNHSVAGGFAIRR